MHHRDRPNAHKPQCATARYTDRKGAGAAREGCSIASQELSFFLGYGLLEQKSVAKHNLLIL